MPGLQQSTRLWIVGGAFSESRKPIIDSTLAVRVRSRHPFLLGERFVMFFAILRSISILGIVFNIALFLFNLKQGIYISMPFQFIAIFFFYKSYKAVEDA